MQAARSLWTRGSSSPPEGKAFRLGPAFFAQTHLLPLEVLNRPATGKVFEACITAEADDGGRGWAR